MAVVGRRTWRTGGQEGREISAAFIFQIFIHHLAFVPCVLGSELIKKKKKSVFIEAPC